MPSTPYYRLDPAQKTPSGGVSPFVRCATRADLPAIVRLHAIALPHFFWTEPAPAFLREFYSFVLRDREGWLLVSERQGQMAGFVAGFSDPSRLLRKIAARRLGLFTSAVACLVRHPIELPGLLRDARRAVCLKDQPTCWSEAACELVTIAVGPQFRGQGHGRALTQALIEAARSSRLSEVRVSVDTKDKAMAYFYRRLGFGPFRAYRTIDGQWMDEYVFATPVE